jgi:tetratricopeptide (TPR) repeat protein
MRRALDLDPTHYSAHYLLAVALKNLLDHAGAATHYSRFLAEAPRDAQKRPNALYGRALCEAMGEAGGKGAPPRRCARSGAPGASRSELKRRLEEAKACETELEAYWGEYDVPDKALLEMMVMAGGGSR